MFSLYGSGLGGGIAIGRARVLSNLVRDVERYHIQADQKHREIRRLEGALRTVHDDLLGISEGLPEDAPGEASALIDVHMMILADPMLVEGTRALIDSDLRNAEWALASQTKKLVRQFQQLDSAYLRERGRDVQQVSDRIVKALVGSSRATSEAGTEPLVFVADDISPSDMLELKHAAGFVIDLGGSTSHTAILARSMDVPATIGMECASDFVQDDDWIILDGDAGLIICAPDDSVLAEYRHRQASRELERTGLRRLIHVPSRSLDGVEINLQANIELPEEAGPAIDNGAQGVGLFRTEFLFMNREELPNEEEQFEAYRSAVETMDGRVVTIRTLDLGADKTLKGGQRNDVSNPALGLRAIRFCLTHPDIFLTQLRAILRASAYGPVRILLPMVTHHHEIVQSLKFIDRARVELDDRRLPVADEIPVGGMVEVPAAALSAGFFLRRLDFLSIGTNDLIQYTLAIDRADHEVAPLYDSFHPAVLRLIAQTVDAARKADKPVSVCGEMAGNPEATRLLLGMGIRELSMHPVSLLRVKHEVLLSEVNKLTGPVSRLMRSDDPAKVTSALNKMRQ
ncbi:MAG: phosphoenolpyruvate--protein phosphotransferase, partial [Burkholderiaceae bacterium]